MAPAAGSSDLFSYLTGAGLAAVVNFPRLQVMMIRIVMLFT